MRTLDREEVGLRRCRDCAESNKLDEKDRVIFRDKDGHYIKSTVLTCPHDVCPYHELDTPESARKWYSQFDEALTKKLLGSLGKGDGNENK